MTTITLEDKYRLDSDRIFVTGIQALVRLPLMQRWRDQKAGLKTGGFISGYRGSPIGGYDQALWQARAYLSEHDIHFEPGVNEDLAATAVTGSQQVNLNAPSGYDGVFGIWYGKGPGVDRSGDAIKHGNFFGTSPAGGVLMLIGDDHMAKSSSIPHQSEQALVHAAIPMLNPADLQEYLDYGLFGIALSRFSACWVGMKCVTETIEGSASLSGDPDRIQVHIPEFQIPQGGVHIREFEPPPDQEIRMIRYKLPAVRAFVKANSLDRVTLDAPRRRFGIVTTGRTWHDVRQALEMLGISNQQARELGITIYKVAMPWPLETDNIRAYAQGHEEILVLEEKRDLIESQLARVLYDSDDRPRLVGKTLGNGETFVPSDGELTLSMVTNLIARRLLTRELPSAIKQRLHAELDQAQNEDQAASLTRMPWFCSGCPHNTSTVVPQGSRAMAGIGCHAMALFMPNRKTASYTHMGGEGANWIGQAPFARDSHVFQNLGDGTYYHSGVMAVRAAVAANVNITYKILYNDAVAMTGGQPVDNLSPWQITQQVYGEGVRRIVVVSDEPDKYPRNTQWAPGVSIHHRDELDQVQRKLREHKGVSVLVYDQVCAAEKRRRRKRGTFPDPAKRAFINELVCEGCGDCGVVSNCVSVKPLETEFGRKRVIDQSTCNKDYACVNGFCPSFVTVHGGQLKIPSAVSAYSEVTNPAKDVPLPELVTRDETYNILVTGIGGTGVVTVGALLGMAAHIDGKSVTVLDQTGLAQKNGAVVSHVRIATNPATLGATRIPDESTDLVLGCGMVVAASDAALATYQRGRTQAVINDHLVPVATFALDPDMSMDARSLRDLLDDKLGSQASVCLDATTMATALLGNSIAANLFVVGFAFQRGLVPLSFQAIDRAIELNAIAVETNRRTFAWGRLAAVDLDQVQAAARPETVDLSRARGATDLEQITTKRERFLSGYQDDAYARRYKALVDRVRSEERDKAKGLSGMAEAVAQNYFKLLAYKDEYEVARLHSSESFRQQLHSQFEGNYKLHFHLAPPLFAKRDPHTGHLLKREYGAWVLRVFAVLAKLKSLRGTALDIFGYTAERKRERRLIAEYESLVEEVLANLNVANHATAVQLLAIPAQIRGFGHVKEANIGEAKAEEQRLLALYRRGDPGDSRSVA